MEEEAIRGASQLYAIVHSLRLQTLMLAAWACLQVRHVVRQQVDSKAKSGLVHLQSAYLVRSHQGQHQHLPSVYPALGL